MENPEETELQDSKDSSTVRLIYEDANNSLKFARDDINAINTKLNVLLGFDATFVRLSMDLPGQCTLTNSLNCHSCQWLKAITLILTIVSIASALQGFYPTPVATLIFPKNLLNILKSQIDLTKSEADIEDGFREAVIEKRDVVVRNLLALSAEKAKNLKVALTLLGLAASASAIDLLIHLFYCQ